MKKNSFASIGLSAIVIMNLISPAFAIDNTHSIEVYYDDASIPAQRFQVNSGSTIKDMKLFEEGESTLAGIKLESGDYFQENNTSMDDMTGTLPNGTIYTFSTKSLNSLDALYLSTSNVADDIKITINTDVANYSIIANSGEYGTDNNYGNINKPTCTVSESSKTVDGGEPFSITFTPNSGKQIDKLNIRTGYSNKTNLVDIQNTSVTIEGQSFQINKLNDGSVSISSQSVVSDLFITALTSPKANEYKLSVSTDPYITSNVETASIFSDKASSITFTPDSEHSIYKFIITQGNLQKTIYATDSSISIGNNTYTLNKSLNGQIIINIPKAVADVKIDAYSTSGTYFIDVNEGSHVDSNYEDVTWVGLGEDATVVLTPHSGYSIEYVNISIGDNTIKVSSNNTSVSIGGKTYRMEKTKDGMVYIYLKDISRNVEITPYVEDTTVDLTIKIDNGIKASEVGTIEVSTGDVYQAKFEPVNDCIIEEIKIERNGVIYKANKSDSYITVNGQKCPLSWQADGSVYVTIYNIDKDTTLQVTSDYASGKRYITKKADSHTTITHDAKNSSYANIGESVNVVITPDDGYGINYVTLSTSTDTITIYRNTNRFALNNRAYYVTHNNSGSWTINFTSLPESITISSYSVKQDISTPATAGYHNAYVNGMGNGLFNPDKNMTRAEAVTMLARVFYNVNPAGYDSSYSDVSSNDWYNGYIGWAQANNILDMNIYFRPNDCITRMEFLELLMAFGKVDTTSYFGLNSNFSDLSFYWLSTNRDKASKIAYAVANGWISGYPDGTFRPDSFITRAELVQMINNVTGRDPDKQVIQSNYYNLVKYVDVPSTHWAFYEIIEASNNHHFENLTGNENWTTH